jgi:formate hydrogenlyase subunit 3/multisubunit Na+/H+ antiporter MnhD subunit
MAPSGLAPDAVTTPGGALLVLALVLPVAGLLLAFVAGGRGAERIVLATLPLGLGLAIAIGVATLQGGPPPVYLLGGWVPPLGVVLRADALAAVMMVTTAVVVGGVGVFARTEFHTPAGTAEARAPLAFWLLLLGVWAGLNTVFLAGDLFTLYVALELLTFAAVPLVCLDGQPATLAAALRYALFALMGSVLYLVGTVLLYGEYGMLDIVLLSGRARADAPTLVACALMTVGLLAKTALFPLHLWLPPAHAGALPPASAVLSALVVKGSFFIVVRLWFDVMPGVPGLAAAELLAALGAAAIVVGNIVALRQERLKLLIAYSTLAQIGYLFLMFPLAFDPGSGHLERGAALTGGLLQTISHATAKAAMFLAAGLMYGALGHDRIVALGGVGRARPLTVLAFALGGLALVGPPPSGAYLAKELLLQAADESGQWWWGIVMQAGGVLTGGYLVLVLVHALSAAEGPVRLRGPVPRLVEAAPLTLAGCSLLLGLAPWAAHLGLGSGTVPALLTPAALGKGLWPILGGGVLAVLLGRWRDGLLPVPGRGIGAILGPARQATLAVGGLFERADGGLRQWPAAGLSLLALAILFGALMVAGR